MLHALVQQSGIAVWSRLSEGSSSGEVMQSGLPNASSIGDAPAEPMANAPSQACSTSIAAATSAALSLDPNLPDCRKSVPLPAS